MSQKLGEKTLTYVVGAGANIGTSFLFASHPIIGALFLGAAALSIVAEGFIQSKGEDAARRAVEAELRKILEQGHMLDKAIELAAANSDLHEMVSRERAALVLQLMRKQNRELKELIEKDTELLVHVSSWIEQWCITNDTKVDALSVQLDEIALELSIGFARVESRVEQAAAALTSQGAQTQDSVKQILQILQPDLDREIVEASDRIKRGGYGDGIILLQKLLSRIPNTLTERQRFRVHANLGHGFEGKDEFDLAAAQYMQAQQVLPGDPKAECLRFAARLYLKEAGLETEVGPLRVQYVDEPLAHALWVRFEPDSRSPAEIELAIPEAIRADVEVQMALSVHASHGGLWDEAERYARSAVAGDPENIRIKKWLGELLVEQQRQKAVFIDDDHAVPPDTGKVHEAIELLSDVINAIGFTAGAHTVSSVRRARGLAYNLLGDPKKSERDLLAALDREPNDPAATLDYALIKLRQGEDDHAIEALKPIVAKEPSGPPDVQLALMLANRGKGSDRSDAIDVLRRGLDASNGWQQGLISQSTTLLVELIQQRDGLEPALAELKTRGALIADPTRYAVECAVRRASGDREGASAAVTNAVAALQPSSSREEKRLVAVQLGTLTRYADALPLWKDIVQPAYISRDTLQLLDCASRCGDDATVIEFCRALRRHGIYDASCVDLETTTLCEYHGFTEAIGVLQEFIAKYLDDNNAKIARVRLSAIGIDLRRPDLIELDLAKLPDVKTVHARLGEAVVHVLSHGKDTFRAVEYAYELVRRHFSREAAHRAIIRSFLFGTTQRPVVPASDVVKAGFAVQYQQDGEKTAAGFVIEDSRDPAPDFARDEVAPSDHRAEEVNGKAVGEQFFLRKDSIQDITAKVTEIIHKSIFRLRDTMQHFEERFGSKFIFTVDVGTPDGGHDFSPIFRSVDEKIEGTRRLDSGFRENRWPVTAYAAAMNSSVVEAFEHVATTQAFPIISNRGSDEELSGASQMLFAAKEVVLAPSAAAILMLTSAYKTLKTLPFTFLITHSTIVEYRRLYEEVTARHSSSGFLTKIGSQHVFIEVTLEQLERRGELLREFIEWLEATCTVVDGTPLAYTAEPERSNLQKCLGSACSESIAVARERHCVIFEEDQGVQDLAALTSPIQRVWTQALLHWQVEHDRFSEAEYHRATIALLRCGNRFTRINARTVQHVLDVNNWTIDHSDVALVLSAFADDTASPESIIRVAIDVLRMIWQSPAIRANRDAATQALLDAIGRRVAGRSYITRIAAILRAASVHDIQLFFLDQFVRNWIHTGSVTNMSWI